MCGFYLFFIVQDTFSNFFFFVILLKNMIVFPCVYNIHDKRSSLSLHYYFRIWFLKKLTVMFSNCNVKNRFIPFLILKQFWKRCLTLKNTIEFAMGPSVFV